VRTIQESVSRDSLKGKWPGEERSKGLAGRREKLKFNK